MNDQTQAEGAITRTDAPVPRARLEADVKKGLETVYGGGIAIVPLDVAYAIVGHKENGIRKIFAAKQRSYEKPSGLLANADISDTIHILPDAKRRMVREMIEKERLPFSVVAPFRADHRFFKSVDPFVMANSSKAGTIDMLLNAGSFHDEIARQAWAAQKPVFGSSANTSLMGSKYRLDDVEEDVRAAADIAFDYGLSKYANHDGRSSTIIDFRDFSVVRIGVQFDRLEHAFLSRFGVTLKRPA